MSSTYESLYTKLGIKTYDEIVASTLQAIIDSNVGITNINAGSVLRTLTEQILINDDLSNYYIAYIYKAMGLDEAEDGDIDRIATIIGKTRKSATYGTGVVTMSTGGDPALYDIAIPYGYIISTRQDSEGNTVQFKISDTTKVLPAGSSTVDVNVVAMVAGNIFIPAGSLCVLNSSILGIASVVNTNAISSGLDEETDDAFKNRIKESTASYGKCTDAAIKSAVEEILGVISCTIIDMISGVGTTGVLVATNSIPPSPEIQASVLSAVKLTKASGINAIITYPTIIYINVDITMTNIEASLYQEIADAIDGYSQSLDIGQTFIIKQMERHVLNSIDTSYGDNDVVDITTNAPTTNQIVGSTQVVRIGTVTVNTVEFIINVVLH